MHVIVSKTVKHLERYNILNNDQHGFRAKRSCETQILTLYHELAASPDKKIQTDMIILDFSKAFDRVPLQRLLKKIPHYGIRGNTHRWISAFQNTECTSRWTVVGESPSNQWSIPGACSLSSSIPDVYQRPTRLHQLQSKTLSSTIVCFTDRY